MELWLVFGILSYLSFAISTSIDKHFMNTGYQPVSTDIFKMFFDGVIVLVIGFLFFQLTFTVELFLISLLLGGLYAMSGILYYTSLQLKDVEVVIPYVQSTTILLVFISSILLFNDSVTLFNYAGVGLILVGVYAILSKNGVKLPTIDKAMIFILLMVVLNTIYVLLVKKFLVNIQPINLAVTMYFSTTLILAGYLWLSKKQKKLFDIKSSKIVISAVFGAIGTLLLYSALSIGNASQVYPIAGLQAVFVFVIASFFLKEKFYWHRLIGTLLVVVGIYFIAV